MSPRAHARLAAATGLFMVLVFGALLAPLEALRGRILPRAAKDTVQSPPGDPEPSLPARAAFAERYDGGGRLRRLYFPDGKGLVGTSEERARELLDREGTRLGLTTESQGEGERLQLESVRTSPSGTHVRFQQTMSGIPVSGGEVVVSFGLDSNPTVVASDLAPVPRIQSSPAVTPEAAIVRALAQVGAQATVRPPEAQLEVHRFGSDWRLAYRVRFVCEAPTGDWEVWVDAADGSVREVRDRTVYEGAPRHVAAGISGRCQVFLPDPVTSLGDPSLSDQEDSDAAVPASAYQNVTLRDLDPPLRNWYRLNGPYVQLEDWESPLGAPDSSLTPDFVRTRSQQGFEDVMVYYHIDAQQRWYQSLGFVDADNRPQPADAHGLRGQDNSKYVPSLGKLAFGEGGVDDAEDAGVIVHEYSHAVQYHIVPTWGGGHELAMGEGFGDYMANSYASALYPDRVHSANGVFEWDGHNAFWPGRPAIDPAMHYPEAAGGEVHWSGTLWCSALTDGLYSIGDRAVMDRLVLDHIYELTGSATMEDAANAILASDVELYAGAHLDVLAQVFTRWGMLGSSGSPIVIEHTPLDIVAAAEGLPTVRALVISSAASIDPQSVLIWARTPPGAFMAFPMSPQGVGLFAGSIAISQGTSQIIEYYLEAHDRAGNVARFPEAAPDVSIMTSIGLYAERFESESGWQAGAPGDDATSGTWVRAVPVGTSAQPGTDHTPGGTVCFVTGNAAPGLPASEGDVDGGATTLLSPVYDLHNMAGATLRYWRWYSNNLGSFPSEDLWAVDVSNDAGRTWTPVERSMQSETAWKLVQFDLGAAFGKPGFAQLRFVATDYNGNSLVEAAVDDVTLLAVPPAPSGHGRRRTPEIELARNDPRSGITTLQFVSTSAGDVRFDLFDVRGRLVRHLVDGRLEAGPHQVRWDGRDDLGQSTAHGTYFAHLVTPNGTASSKVSRLP